jgi:hypothetical protein
MMQQSGSSLAADIREAVTVKRDDDVANCTLVMVIYKSFADDDLLTFPIFEFNFISNSNKFEGDTASLEKSSYFKETKTLGAVVKLSVYEESYLNCFCLSLAVKTRVQ